MRAMKVYEFINCLISTLSVSEKYEKCNFAILCDKFPIIVGKGSFRARVLYVSLNSTERIYYDRLKELGLEYITITANVR